MAPTTDWTWTQRGSDSGAGGLRPRGFSCRILMGGLVATALAAWMLLAPPPVRAQDEVSDPIETVNRGVFWFNDKLDVYFLEPVATAWDFVLPDPVQRSITNFFANAHFPVDFANNLFQGKPEEAGRNVGRFLINTTVGVAGFFDPASHWGIEEAPEDFGQTLGRWGTGSGAYIVIPFLGPSNVRDGFGILVDIPLSVYPFFIDTWVSFGINGVRAINLRADLLEEVDAAKETSLDYYAFVRNAYHQRREALIRDGEIPEAASEDEDDLYYLDF